MDERKQSGVIPYFYDEDNKLRIMLISKEKGVWGFPKGGVESGMTVVASAMKEAREEAGISGKPGQFLGISRYVKKGVPQKVQWYLMSVTKEHKHYEEENVRKRKWFSVKKALDKVEDKWRPILNVALTRLK